jgi:hypothetical protein
LEGAPASPVGIPLPSFASIARSLPGQRVIEARSGRERKKITQITPRKVKKE